MSFICPVEGCDTAYADWASLREHLSEEHDQDVTRESYRAWREEVGLNRETEQKQQQNEERNRDRTGPLITPLERDVSLSDVSDTSLSCPVCGKVFDKGNLVSSFNSVKMHAVKSHGRQLQLSEFGLGEEEKASTPPRRHVVETEEEGRPSIPDPYEHLKTMLTTFGLSSKNAAAISKYMESYSVDDLYKLIEGAAEYLPRSRLKLFVESWANVRGIPIAPELQEELGISHMPTSYGRHRPQQYDYRYGRRDRDWQPEPKDEISQLIDKEYDELRRIRVIQALQGGGEEGSEVKMLRDELRRDRDSRVEELEKRLTEERELRHKQEIAALREEFNLKLEGFRKEEGGLLERQAVRAIERVGDVSEKLVGLGERIVVGTAYKHHLLQEEAPPPRERQGPSGIASLIPEEFIERRVEEEVEG